MADMRWASKGGVSAAMALAVCACHPVEHKGGVRFLGPDSGFMQVNTRLDCPETSGDLTRSGMSADGKSCAYTGPNDEAVSLQLVPLAGVPPQLMLTKMETQLQGDTGLTGLTPPEPPSPPPPPAGKAKDWDAGSQAKSDDDNDDDDESKASNKAGADRDNAKIDLPGLHISANGDKADISLPGISIHANGDKAEVHAGWLGRNATIEGNDGGAVIRIGHADQSGVDSMMFMTSNHPGPTGYRTIGYIAKGPPAGPMLIATFKTKSENRNEHDPAGDGVKKLINLNAFQGFGWHVDTESDGDKGAKT